MKMDQIKTNCLMANTDFFEDSKLLSTNELDKEYKNFSLTEGEFEVAGPVIANFREDGKRKNYSHSGAHCLIVGGTGSGKSQCYYRAQLEAYPRSKNQPSVFVMDLKGEYYCNYASLYKDAGYDVYVFNLKEPFESSRYNPLAPAWEYYQNSVEAKKLLQNANGCERTLLGQEYKSFEEWKQAVQIYQNNQMQECQSSLTRLSAMIVPIESTKDPSWEYGARQMFYAQAIGLLEDSEYPERNMTREKFTIANIIRITSCTQDDCYYIRRWIEARDKASVVQGLNHYYTTNAKITREGFLSCFSTKVDRWNNISAEWVTSNADIDVEMIAKNVNEQKVAIFCITDETRPEGYDICMAFIDNLISALKIRNDKIGPIERDFHILADEFANMPPLPKITNRITTLRSYRLWLHMGIQSFEQLDEKYGEKARSVIIDNCDCQVFFGTNNTKTVKEFAKSLGGRIAAITSYSIGNDGKLSLSISAANIPIVRQSDLAYLKLGEAYIKVFRHSSILTKLEPHFMCEDLYHDNTKPEKVMADLSQLEKSRYDIRDLEDNRPKTKFDWNF